MSYTIIVVFGLLSGIIGALVGLGGGVILVPALLYFGITLELIPSLTTQNIVGLSVIMMIFVGLSSTLSYVKSGTVDYKSGLILFAGSVPGTLVGAYISKYLDVPSFNLYFGILLVIIAIILIFRDRFKPIHWFVKHGQKINKTDNDGNQYTYGYPIWFAFMMTFFIGMASGMFGIGGGSMIVPMLVILFLFPPHIAVATSMFLVFLTSIVNSASHIYYGHIPWNFVIAVVPAAYIGAKFGAALNKKLQSDTVILLLRILLLVLGIRSIIVGLL
ncbi:sulfite exporter TauE/SafE family protein [Kurthia sibirica]|uniref:Probable membrane transporter protein n=1 Tax=Kurthia sibirica TaxID=202750 RepID=A0A2U3AIY5_9BACL|nr:sulfite exporter TauE/SafE family protein [Kurthia sibirica]PWI24421.1 hypothetical protein DEX24_13880 [Kurthia sibirica]GEK33839.1 UPF0721 transmembrane protein YunE [Kurthia sibirica]